MRKRCSTAGTEFFDLTGYELGKKMAIFEKVWHILLAGPDKSQCVGRVNKTYFSIRKEGMKSHGN